MALLASTVDSDWVEIHRAILEEASRLTDGNLPLLSTFCLSSGVLGAEAQVQELLEETENWAVDGCYVVCEPPNGEYLVTDPNWLANILDLLAGLKLRGRQVILGYCNHQHLVAATAAVDAIASGTWMNVRSFPPGKFLSSPEDEIQQRKSWYYCPQALSEFQIPFLDIAQRLGVLADMAPVPPLPTDVSAPLFSGVQPTTTGFAENDAFRHYLACLKAQTTDAQLGSFDETVQHHERLLDEAGALLSRLHAAGVRGQLRDFSEIADVNRGALAVHVTNRGAMLRRMWHTM